MSDQDALCALGVSPVLAEAMGVSCGTVAAAGSSQSDAAICPQFALVTGANGSLGVKVNLKKGELAVIRNVANGALKVYTMSSSDSVYIAGTATPQSGDTAITIAAYYTLILVNATGTGFIALEVIGA
jgi:hypothetical protein